MVVDVVQFVAMFLMAMFGVVMYSDVVDLKRSRRKGLYNNLPPPKAIEGPAAVCHCGGVWGKWAICVISKDGGKGFDGQKRTCEECGYTEVKKFKEY